MVDDVSFEFVKGATVDYVEEMIRSSFAIAENPNSDGMRVRRQLRRQVRDVL